MITEVYNSKVIYSIILEEDLMTISADLDPTNTLSSGPEASDSGHLTPNETTLSDM